jgi:hypothetical protein
MQMEIPFSHLGHQGRVIITSEKTLEPAILGAREGATGLANCKATIEFPAGGYLELLGWVQLVCSTDNSSHGRKFEMDPFDVFDLDKHAPSPYCWYGINPTLFDAPSRGKRVDLDWVAHSFLAASPLHGKRRITAPLREYRRIVMPLLGFSWGFHIFNKENIELKSITSLTAADWASHLPYLRKYYKKWQFMEMLIPTN